ncbi:MAG TPA: hypothetical protein VIQ30_22815 [Pseudonocardia sp.]
MVSIPDPLAARISSALERADPGALARTDQLAGLWRDYFTARDLDLTDPDVADSALRAMTMIYGLLMAAHADGELDPDSWQVVNDVLASSSAAVSIARSTAVVV